MAEGQGDNQLYFFSGKVLFLSLIFIVINLALYFVMLRGGSEAAFREVAPRLVFSEDQQVELKTPFDEAFSAGHTGQSVLTGSDIKTGPKSYAELRLEGNSIRLDENTEVVLAENNFMHPEAPRFVLNLKAGSLWINAFDPMLVKSGQVEAKFAQSVGMIHFADPLNRVFAVTGNVDLNLYDQAGTLLTQFVVPLKNQVTFSNSQLQPVYAKLEYSKLKKELKMGRLADSVLEESWVKRNTRDDASALLASNHYIFSLTQYHFLNRYHSLREKLALIPARKRLERLTLATIKLKYLLGYLQENGDMETAKTVLDEFSAVAAELPGDPLLDDLVQDQFFVIRNVRTDTPAYLVKEKLRQMVYAEKKDPALFRSYLADLDYLLRARALKQAEEVAKQWYEQWTDGLKQTARAEFNHQARIYLSLILANTDSVSRNLLSLLDDIGNYRLQHTDDYEETLLEIATERLDISKFLVASKRYLDAKNYLKTSYSNLDLAAADVPVAARDLFIKEATLIGDRIAFAEQNLKGSAGAIDEAKFRDYLLTQERDKSLAERFLAFIEETKPVDEVPVVYPTVPEVVDRFTDSRIIVIQEDVATDPQNPFVFAVASARLSDRAEDGSSITFSAQYDYATNAVYDVVLQGKALAGTFSLDDLVRVALAGDTDIAAENVPVLDKENVADYLDVKGINETERDQVVAQDLAIQLLIKELGTFDISIPSVQSVLVLNKATLSEFRVMDAFVTDEEADRQAAVVFDINTVTNVLTNVKVKEAPTLVLPAQIAVGDLAPQVFTNLYGLEKELAEAEKVVRELSQDGLILKASDMKFVSGSNYDRVDFRKVVLKDMPIQLAGTYERSTNRFTQASYASLNATDVAVSDFLKLVSEFWVVNYLNEQGISVSKNNIATQLPAAQFSIRNYVRGSKRLSFVFDVTGNRLTNVTLEGLDTVVPSMTFDEFSLIQSEDLSTPAPPPEEIIIEEDITFDQRIGSCGRFIENLEKCAKFACEFLHPVTNEPMTRRISGQINGKCRYTEQMPDNQIMTCDYTQEYQAAVAQQHSDLLPKEVMVTSVTFGEDVLDKTYNADGKTLTNPAAQAFDEGQCVISTQ